MFGRIRQILEGEKGQSLTEWALVAVFAVGLFFLFRGSGLLSQVKESYNDVGSYLSGTQTTEQAIQKYGTLSNAELMQSVDNAARIAMDDATLRNIAGAFLGKTQTEIRAMLMKDANFSPYNPKGQLNQGNLLFDYYIENTGENGAVKTSFNNGLVAKDNLLNWMQGNYTDFQSNQAQLVADNRFFFSNDLIDPSGVLNGTEHQAGNYAVSVRCSFEFTNNKVSAVQIWAARNKEDSNNKGKWIRNETQGVNGTMNIKVTE